jgi:ATP-dependent Lhr-like helicase
LPGLSHDENALANIKGLIEEQRSATGIIPGSRHLVLERCRDEMGDWRVILHSPYGRRVHEPGAGDRRTSSRVMGADASIVASDDGIVARLPDTEEKRRTPTYFFSNPKN